MLKITTIARSEVGGNKGQITSTPEFVRIILKNPSLRQSSYSEYSTSIRGMRKTPAPENKGGAYFRVVNGPQAGMVVDLSKEKYLGQFMSSATKMELMHYGFAQLDLKKIGNVTFDQFAKANTYYLQTLRDSGSSSTGAVRQALSALQKLGDQAFPNRPKSDSNLGISKPVRNAAPTTWSPWLQDQVNSGKMTTEQAVQIIKNQRERERTTYDGDMKTCHASYEITDVDTDHSGSKLKVDARIAIEVEGSFGTVGTEMQATLKNSQGRSVKKINTGIIPGNSSEKIINYSYTQPYDYSVTKVKPQVELKGKCHFSDGTVVEHTARPTS